MLADNEPSHRHYYVVTVSTGLRPFAGTTAKVGIFVQGELDHSDPHLLNEKDNGIFFGSGHEDSFLLTVPWPLGKLMSIVLWHNGEGTSPSWYVCVLFLSNREFWSINIEQDGKAKLLLEAIASVWL